MVTLITLLIEQKSSEDSGIENCLRLILIDPEGKAVGLSRVDVTGVMWEHKVSVSSSFDCIDV